MVIALNMDKLRKELAIAENAENAENVDFKVLYQPSDTLTMEEHMRLAKMSKRLSYEETFSYTGEDKNVVDAFAAGELLATEKNSIFITDDEFFLAHAERVHDGNTIKFYKTLADALNIESVAKKSRKGRPHQISKAIM